MKTVVYTAIFGGKDVAPELVNKQYLERENIDLICFSDDPNLKSEDYEIRLVPKVFSDVTKNARNVKINGFDGIENYDVAIWHDSSVHIHADMIPALVQFSSRNILSTFHHVRYCAYREAIACIDQKKDSPVRIALQMFHYYRRGLPANYMLHETTILVLNRKKYFSSELRQVWWNEIVKRSRRDQLSLPYARFKTQTKVGLLGHWKINRTNNVFSTFKGHLHERYDDGNFLLTLNSYILRAICKKAIFAMRKRS